MTSFLPSFWNERSGPFSSLQKDLDRLFGKDLREFPAALQFANGFPAIDVEETEDGLLVTAELPGVSEKDIDVSVSDRTLTIKGEKREEHETREKDRHVSERSYGAFRRSLVLPFAPDLDAVDAHVSSGVLTVRLKKPAEAREHSRRIDVARKD